jgi:hypothetical protein
VLYLFLHSNLHNARIPRCKDKRNNAWTKRSIIPFLIQVIYQTILVLASPTAAGVVLTQRNTAVASARGKEAGAGGCQDDEHVLWLMLAQPLRGVPQRMVTHPEEPPNASPHLVVG